MVASSIGRELLDEGMLTREQVSSFFHKGYEDLERTELNDSIKINEFLAILKIVSTFQSGPIGIQKYIALFNDLKSYNDQRIDLTFCIDSMIKEIEAEDSIDSLDILDSLPSKDFDCIRDLISIQLSSNIAEFIDLSTRPTSDSQILNILKLIEKAIEKKINFGSELDTVFDICCDFLISAYNLHIPGNPAQQASKDVEKIIHSMSLINRYASQISDYKFQIIKEGIQIRSEEFMTRVIPQLSHSNCLHSLRKTNYTVQVFEEIFPEDNVHFAIKEYSNIKEKALAAIENEITILRYLSDLSSDSNCYLKIYGFEYKHKTIRIYMEYCRNTLAHCINYWMDGKNYLSEDQLMLFVRKLLQTFSELEHLKIHHRDIKPDNILVTDDMNFKIIDFSIARRKIEEDEEQTNSAEGTTSYMAPEVLELLKSEKKRGRYSLGKADVFSLGLIFYQMATLKQIRGLNERANHAKLMERIERMSSHRWIKPILVSMLKLDYHERSRFKKLMGRLESLPTTSTV